MRELKTIEGIVADCGTLASSFNPGDAKTYLNIRLDKASPNEPHFLRFKMNFQQVFRRGERIRVSYFESSGEFFLTGYCLLNSSGEIEYSFELS